MGSSPRSCSCTISPRIPDSRTSLVELYSALDNLGLLIEGIPSEVKSSVTKITGERRLSFSITKISRHHIKAKIYEGPLWGMALKSDHQSDMESKISLALSMFPGRWIPACVMMFPRKATSPLKRFIERSGNMGCVGRGEGGGGGGKGGGDDTISFVLVCWLFFSSRFEKIK